LGHANIWGFINLLPSLVLAGSFLHQWTALRHAWFHASVVLRYILEHCRLPPLNLSELRLKQLCEGEVALCNDLILNAIHVILFTVLLVVVYCINWYHWVLLWEDNRSAIVIIIMLLLRVIEVSLDSEPLRHFGGPTLS
jgi:hypothetical protein